MLVPGPQDLNPEDLNPQDLQAELHGELRAAYQHGAALVLTGVWPEADLAAARQEESHSWALMHRFTAAEAGGVDLSSLHVALPATGAVLAGLLGSRLLTEARLPLACALRSGGGGDAGAQSGGAPSAYHVLLRAAALSHYVPAAWARREGLAFLAQQLAPSGWPAGMGLRGRSRDLWDQAWRQLGGGMLRSGERVPAAWGEWGDALPARMESLRVAGKTAPLPGGEWGSSALGENLASELAAAVSAVAENLRAEGRRGRSAQGSVALLPLGEREARRGGGAAGVTAAGQAEVHVSEGRGAAAASTWTGGEDAAGKAALEAAQSAWRRLPAHGSWQLTARATLDWVLPGDAGKYAARNAEHAWKAGAWPDGSAERTPQGLPYLRLALPQGPARQLLVTRYAGPWHLQQGREVVRPWGERVEAAQRRAWGPAAQSAAALAAWLLTPRGVQEGKTQEHGPEEHGPEEHGPEEHGPEEHGLQEHVETVKTSGHAPTAAEQAAFWEEL